MVGLELARRRSVAAWLLMVGLCLAPSLSLAAMACAPHCCPASAGDVQPDRDPAEQREDCRAGVASRACCSEAPANVASIAPTWVEIPSLQAALPPALDRVVASIDRPLRSFEAMLALRTSPLRLSVVLLI